MPHPLLGRRPAAPETEKGPTGPFALKSGCAPASPTAAAAPAAAAAARWHRRRHTGRGAAALHAEDRQVARDVAAGAARAGHGRPPPQDEPLEGLAAGQTVVLVDRHGGYSPPRWT